MVAGDRNVVPSERDYLCDHAGAYVVGTPFNGNKLWCPECDSYLAEPPTAEQVEDAAADQREFAVSA